MIKLKRLLETQLIKEALPLDMARNYVSIKRNPEITQRLDSILDAIKQRPDAKSSRRGDRIAVKFESKETIYDPSQDRLSHQIRNFYPVLKRYVTAANLYSQRENFDTFELPNVDQIIYGQPKDAYGRTTKMSKFIAAVIAQSDVKFKLTTLEPYVETDAKGKRMLVGTGGSRPWEEIVAQIKQEAKKKIDDILKLYDEIPEIKQARENKVKTFYIVFSKHAYDVAGMSTNRGWTSCMNLYSGINKHYIQYDVENGTMVAYLVANDDLNITRPIARVAIKPFVNTDDATDVFYEPEERVYGTPPHTFLEAVNNIVNAAQPGKTGRFKMVDTLYCDSKRHVTKYGTDNIEQLVANMLKRKQVATTTDEVYYILDNYGTYTPRGGTLNFVDADKLYVDAPAGDVDFGLPISNNNPTYCPIQFKRIDTLRITNLTSFENFPESCHTLVLRDPNVKNFQGCPTSFDTIYLNGGDFTDFSGIRSVSSLVLKPGIESNTTIRSFRGLPASITEIECFNSDVDVEMELQDLIQQVKPLNLQKLSLPQLIININNTSKLRISFNEAVKKTLSTLENPTSQTMEVVAYFMTLQQILNDLPSLQEICNIHRDDIQNKIDALLR